MEDSTMMRPGGEGRQASTWPCAAVLVILLLVVGALTLGPAPGEAADIVYHYDRLGRLIAVVDPSSDTAVYNYDAVGNLLSITRHTSSSVAVIGFDPPSGPVGATVRIQGTGFSATPAQNTVTFNGVTATVSAASATQLVVTVPSGATTGTIGVTAPAGSASSATSFTVATSSGAPTITSFTPTIGVPGTSVSVSGTNFDTTAANNRLQFNVSPGLVSSATSTTLSVPVSNSATSGRLSLVTPGGATQSTDDFFVPPEGAAVADVGHTGRATIGGSGVSVSMTTPAKMALVVFDGTAGQAFAAGFSSLSVSKAPATLFRPDGVQLAAGEVTTTTGAVNSIHSVLPVTGTYTLRFLPFYNFGWQTGSFTLTLSEDPASVPIAIDGAAVTLTLTRPGQHQAATFTGTAGQRLSLAFTSVTADSGVTVRKPDGTTLATAQVFTGAVLDLPDLPATGTYAIWVDPNNAGTGSLTLTLSAEVAGGSIPVDGSSTTVNLTRPGQNGRLTFSGTTGQQLSLAYTGVTTGWPTIISVLNPNGSELTSVWTGGAGVKVLPALPTTGTYTVLVNPYGINTGSLTFWLSTDVTGSISIGGSAVSTGTTRPGQRALLTFSGTASQRISLVVTGVTTDGSVGVTLLKPDGSVISGWPNWSTMTVYNSGTGFIGPFTLPSTETAYVLSVTPNVPATGSLTAQLYNVPADITGSLTVNGSAFTVTFAAPGQKASLTFSATDGQGLTIVGANNSVGCIGFMALYKPNGWNQGWGPVCGNPLTQGTSGGGTGTHTLYLDPGGSTGSVDISVTSP
jgi:YD repeat-containing protein